MKGRKYRKEEQEDKNDNNDNNNNNNNNNNNKLHSQIRKRINRGSKKEKKVGDMQRKTEENDRK